MSPAIGRILPVILIPLIIAASVLAPRTLAFLPAVFALGVYLGHAFCKKELLIPNKYIDLFFIAVIALSFISFLWAEYPDNALDRSFSTAGILFSGFILLAVAQKHPGVQNWSVKGMAVASTLTVSALSLFLLCEYKFGFPVGRHLSGDAFLSSMWNRSMVVLVMAILPCLYLLHKAFRFTPAFVVWVLVLLISITPPILMTQSQTAQIMLLMGLVSYGVARIVPRYLYELTTVITVLLIFATPFIPSFLSAKLEISEPSNFVTSASMPHRLEVWNFVAGKIMERPLTGHGVECIRSMKSATIMPHIKSDTILHPHNAFLQIWVETGLIGALLTAVFAVFILYRIKSSPPETRPLYFAIFVAALSLLSTGYGLWQSWQMGLLLAAAAMAIAFSRISAPPKA